MQHGNASWICGIDMQTTCGRDIKHGHEEWIYSIVMQYGEVA
jgi:hypothetical protein